MHDKIKNEELIKLLKLDSDFISGAEIARALGVTRAAIWKKIKLLKKSGYRIETSYSKGYRLTHSPDLSIEEVRNALSDSGQVIGREILFFDTIGSTNTLASEYAGKDCPEGTVIIAEHQTGGRGRRGRVWASPPGANIYMSIIVRPSLCPRDASLLTLMTAVACAAAVRKLSPIPVSIKWPNDIMVTDKKLGGILTEMKADMERISYAVLGIGLNINLDRADMPDEIKALATSVKSETGNAASRTSFIIEILKELEHWYALLLREGRAPVIKEWLRLSSTIGRTVTVSTNADRFTGIAEGIDDEGMLILRLPDQSTRTINSGDVVYARSS
ncbi:MAG: biotin--[acetyl-CoA-carboxylase] ligase [Nitrospirota bacterium]